VDCIQHLAELRYRRNYLLSLIVRILLNIRLRHFRTFASYKKSKHALVHELLFVPVLLVFFEQLVTCSGSSLLDRSSRFTTACAMGNSQSAPHSAKRKRSVAFSQLTSSRCTATSSSVETFVNPNHHNEKSIASSYALKSDNHDTSLPPPLYDEKLAVADLVEDELSLAYKSFLNKYPEYKLTWLLDSLRKSDFTRLDRTGEVYVDYMGGALYPESLVRLHSAFLHRSVLGNTHSVNNRCASALHVTF
jgi:hypothetical protein